MACAFQTIDPNRYDVISNAVIELLLPNHEEMAHNIMEVNVLSPDLQCDDIEEHIEGIDAVLNNPQVLEILEVGEIDLIDPNTLWASILEE